MNTFENITLANKMSHIKTQLQGAFVRDLSSDVFRFLHRRRIEFFVLNGIVREIRATR